MEGGDISIHGSWHGRKAGGNEGTKQTKLTLTKEKRLQIVSAQCQQVKDLVTTDVVAGPTEQPTTPNKIKLANNGKQLMGKILKGKNVMKPEKEINHEVADATCSQTLRYGKVPRQAALNRKWKEIGKGILICLLRLRAAQKEAKSRTAFARMLLMFFYKKEELKGKRLHDLDKDIVNAIAEFTVIVKLMKPEAQQNDSSEKKKSPAGQTKAAILQSLQTKLNNLYQEDEQRRKRQDKRKLNVKSLNSQVEDDDRYHSTAE